MARTAGVVSSTVTPTEASALTCELVGVPFESIPFMDPLAVGAAGIAFALLLSGGSALDGDGTAFSSTAAAAAVAAGLLLASEMAGAVAFEFDGGREGSLCV